MRRRSSKSDKVRVEDMADWYRAAGECICERCGCYYWDHPPVVGYEWLRKICNGDLVKL